MRGGRTGHAVVVALVMLPAMGIVGLGGVGVIAATQCEWFEPDDCSTAYWPLVVVWVTVCLCAYANVVHGAYTGRGRR